jgi:hypothetical protein
MSRPRDDYEYQKNRGVVLREQPTCTVCNRQPSTQVDHIIPLDAGGGHELQNLRGICFKCNNTLGHRYVTQRNEIRQTIRAEAMRQHGITDIDTKQKRFFTEKNLIPNQPELAAISHDWPRLETIVPDAAGSYGSDVQGWAEQHLGLTLMPWQVRALDGQLAFDEQGELLHRT